MDFMREIVNRLANECEEIKNTLEYPSRAIKTIYFWMMSTIESYYWERRYPVMTIEVWAKDQDVHMHIGSTASQAENYYFCGPSLTDADIDIMFAAFVGIINQSPFRAEGPDIWQNSGWFANRNGMYHMRIHVDGM